ncbi:hypothetical protein E2C01_037479 [Portunus trituberculatus]|uniref:Uncharacterized protein n=1 Tax=Portunus trituberculatus TaxID=210409 RepID=A0A5B7FE79_PORTR|nr:hypothetical protein [Portunus trituberculatus]
MYKTKATVYASAARRVRLRLASTGGWRDEAGSRQQDKNPSVPDNISKSLRTTTDVHGPSLHRRFKYNLFYAQNE